MYRTENSIWAESYSADTTKAVYTRIIFSRLSISRCFLVVRHTLEAN